MYFMKVLYAEHLKSKRTILKKIPFVLAFVIVGFILFVFRSSGKNEIVMNSGNYWITISAMIAPILIGILAGITGEQEQEAGNYQIIRKSTHRGMNFLAKAMYLIGILTFFVVFSMLLLYVSIWCIYKPENYTLIPALKTTLIFIVGSLFLVPFQLWISIYLGMGASIGIGILGTIFVSYISSFPMLEEQLWRVIPWIWTLKTTTLYFENISLSVQGVNLPLDLAIQFVSFVLLLIGVVLWFKNWEGKSKE